MFLAHVYILLASGDEERFLCNSQLYIVVHYSFSPLFP